MQVQGCRLPTVPLEVPPALKLLPVSQFFWEAFPAAGGVDRTVYMFCYADPHPSRPTFAALLDKYYRALPAYQVRGCGCTVAGLCIGNVCMGTAGEALS